MSALVPPGLIQQGRLHIKSSQALFLFGEGACSWAAGASVGQMTDVAAYSPWFKLEAKAGQM